MPTSYLNWQVGALAVQIAQHAQTVLVADIAQEVVHAVFALEQSLTRERLQVLDHHYIVHLDQYQVNVVLKPRKAQDALDLHSQMDTVGNINR